MTRPAAAAAWPLPALPTAGGLAGRLLAVLRPLFAAEVIVPGPADVVLAGAALRRAGLRPALPGPRLVRQPLLQVA